MTIPSSRYVDIASAVVGGQSVAQRKLVGRLFTQSALIPAGTVVSFAAGEVERLMPGTPEAEFASAYFAYVSPAPVSKANELQLAPYSPTGRVGVAYGGDHATLDQLNTITTGTLTATLGQDSATGTSINLSAEMSFADVASEVTNALNIGTVTYDTTTKRFILTGSTTGAGPTSVTSSPLAVAMGFTDAGAIMSPGADAQTPVEAFQESEDFSDSFGSALFISSLTQDEHEDVATYVASLNVKYMYFIDVPSGQEAAYYSALGGTASVGLNMANAGGVSISHLPMAVLAATDYSRSNATVNYMYRRAGVTLPAQVTSGQVADTMDANRINYYGQTSSAGADIAFYQRGSLCGSGGSPVSMSIHANEQWLKAYIAAQWLSLLIDTGGIPANRDGRGRGLLVIGDAITQAINNRTIIAGKQLSAVQKSAVADAAGDALAWHDVQDKGYWYDVAIVPWNNAPSGLPEYKMQYSIVYSKGDWVNKIEGSHQLV